MRVTAAAAAALLCSSLLSRGCGGESAQQYVRRVESPYLYYAAESRNYPEEPDVLFVTARGGGLTAYNISGPAQFDAVARWETDAAVEGQDRIGDLMVVSELGRGPSGPFDGSSGPKLHLFRVGGSPLSGLGEASDATSPAALEPFASLDLSPFIDGILHVKFLQPRADEWWAACSGGFATSVEGALVLVNVTRAVQQRDSAQAAGGGGGGGGGAAAVTLRSDEVTVLNTPVLQPEGVMVVVVAPAEEDRKEDRKEDREEEEGRRLLVYMGGINSTSLGVVDATAFSSPLLLEARPGVGEQLVGARRADQPRWNPTSVSVSTTTRTTGTTTVGDDEEEEEEEEDDDDGLVFMAGWGGQGRLVVLNTSGDKAAAPVVVAQTAPRDSLSLAMANRVKLVFSGLDGGGVARTASHKDKTKGEEDAHSNYDVALVPLEQPRGGFAAVDISGVAAEATAATKAPSSSSSSSSSSPLSSESLRTLEAVHLPLSEFARSGGATTKAYCLAVSSTRHVYLFVAETSAVFIYCLDSALGRSGSCGSGAGQQLQL